MKLLLTMKLSDRSLWYHISPITKLQKIEDITVIRDTPGPRINKVKYPNPSRYGLTSPYLTIPIKLLQLILSSLLEKPSLIHSYLLFPHGYLAFIAGKLTGKKVGVSLLAGPVELYVLGGSPIGRYAYCRPLPKFNIYNKILLSFLKRFDIITVTGNFSKDFLIGKGIDPEKIFLLPHVVDDRFQPLDFQKEFDVVYIGRLAPVKHVETLILATKEIYKILPSIRVAIVGDGEDRDKLQKLTHSLGLINQIEFVGFQTNTWEWYNRGRVSALSSEREGFPYTVIESIKCGVPPIISNCGDVNDIVKDKWNGIIIPDYNDHHAYADAIIDILSDQDKLKQYSENCLKTLHSKDLISVESAWDKIFEMAYRKN